MLHGKAKFIRVMLLLIVTSIIFASVCYAGPAGIVTADQVNLRSAPSADNNESSILGVLYKKDIVQILIERDPWSIKGFVRVKVSKVMDSSLIGAEGWVAEKYLYVPNAD